MVVEILAFLPGILLLILANYSEKRKDFKTITQLSLTLIVILIFVEGLLMVIMSDAESIKDLGDSETYGYVTIITALMAFLIFLRPVRVWISQLIDIKPDNLVHTTALVFAILLVGTSLATAMSFELADLIGEGGMDTLTVVLQDLVFVIASFFGVGWMIRRDFKKTLKRLGLVMPGLRDLVLSLGFLILMFGLVIGVEFLAREIAPDSIMLEGEDPTILLLGGVTVLTAIIFSLGAGIGEEILFRGAMQPRFGIIFTSLIFTLIHIQYFDVLSMLTLFGISLIFGYQRKITNTTSCIITHSLYDMVLMLLVATA